VLAPSHLRTHAKAVRGLWVRRELAALTKATSARCESEGVAVEALLADVRERVDVLAGVVAASEQSTRADAVVERTIAELAAATKSDGRGVKPSGFDRLDRITAGLHTELLLLGARPGMGKTSLATGIAVNVALGGAGVFIASLETVEGQLMTRVLCAEAGIDVQRARIGALTPTEWIRFGEASKTISGLPLWIDETSGMTVAELWAKCRRVGLQLAREGRRLGLVVVDYLQLLKAPRARMTREETVGENARALKAMAQELGITVLGIAQLNRDVDKRPDKRPQLSDLRESGELEQCARTVLFLYREDYYARSKPGHRPTGVAEVAVAKQNNGPTGLARLHFVESCTRFENLPEGEAMPPLCAGCGLRRERADGRCPACGQVAGDAR
jgi:replicative DNA helicase